MVGILIVVYVSDLLFPIAQWTIERSILALKLAKSAYIYLRSSPWNSETDCNIVILILKVYL